MPRIKIHDYQKLFIFFMFFISLIGMIIGASNNKKYDVIQFGKSSFLLPQRIAGEMSRSEDKGYIILESEDYHVLGIDSDLELIDDSLLELFKISNEGLGNINTIKTEYDLLKLLGNEVGIGNIVYGGKTNKPSFDTYFIQLRFADYDEIILLFKSDEKYVIEVIIAPINDIKEKEIIKMHGSMRYHSNR